MLKFRNLTISPVDPVELWGAEGILTALERGTLFHWNKILRSAEHSTQVASELEEALSLSTNDAANQWIRAKRAELKFTVEQRVAQRLNRLLLSSGLTKSEFASRLGTSHSRFSTYLSGKVTPSAAILLKAEDVVREMAI